MSTIREFSIYDMLKFNNVNLDILTETYSTNFYGKYIAVWNEYNVAAQNSNGMIEAYIIGKVEGDKNDEKKKNWHGHVSAVTVAPYFRRQGLARSLMNFLEDVTENQHDGYYVDLFVRSSNKIAIEMYKKFGYVIYQTINKYYSSDGIQPAEDAYDMRKSLKRDVKKECAVETGKTIEPSEIEFI
jgi:N-terminal acetyltransferase B complex catalytic subunit